MACAAQARGEGEARARAARALRAPTKAWRVRRRSEGKGGAGTARQTGARGGRERMRSAAPAALLQRRVRAPAARSCRVALGALLQIVGTLAPLPRLEVVNVPSLQRRRVRELALLTKLHVHHSHPLIVVGRGRLDRSPARSRQLHPLDHREPNDPPPTQTPHLGARKKKKIRNRDPR